MMEACTTNSNVEIRPVVLNVSCDNCQSHTCSFYPFYNKELFNVRESYDKIDGGLFQADILC